MNRLTEILSRIIPVNPRDANAQEVALVVLILIVAVGCMVNRLRVWRRRRRGRHNKKRVHIRRID